MYQYVDILHFNTFWMIKILLQKFDLYHFALGCLLKDEYVGKIWNNEHLIIILLICPHVVPILLGNYCSNLDKTLYALCIYSKNCTISFSGQSNHPSRLHRQKFALTGEMSFCPNTYVLLSECPFVRICLFVRIFSFVRIYVLLSDMYFCPNIKCPCVWIHKEQ